MEGQKNPNILNGQQNWKAEVRGDSIVAVAECGGKATFVKGRLVSFSAKGGTVLDFVQENGRTSEVRSSSSGVVLTVETDLKTGAISGLRFGGKTVNLEMGQRPMVQSIQKQNLVTAMAATLNKVTLPDGTIKTYDFAVNDKVQPTLKTQDHLYLWDAESGRILADGEWTYPTTDLGKEGVARKNAKGQTESWFYDGTKVEEITVGVDGVKTIASWFVSGKLSGKPRQRKEVVDGKIRVVWTNSYGEKGQLLRVAGPASVAKEIKYDEQGRIKEILNTEQKATKILYSSNGSKEIIISIGKSSVSRTYDPDGNFVKTTRTYPDRVSAN